MANKDFIHETSYIFGGGKYINLADKLRYAPSRGVEIRYNKLRDVVVLSGNNK